MTNKFKIGDRIFLKDYEKHSDWRDHRDQVGTITEISNSDKPISVKWKDEQGSALISFDNAYLATGKAAKIKPKNFRVIQSSCNNHVGDYETLEEAKEQVPEVGDTNKIYKLVAEAISEVKVKVKTIK